MENIIAASVLFAISLLAFGMSVRSFLGKGPLLNNAYIYATKEERERMNKTPHYRQSGVVFSLLGLIFFLNGLDALLKTDWMLYLVLALFGGTLVYAIVSSIWIEKKK